MSSCCARVSITTALYRRRSPSSPSASRLVASSSALHLSAWHFQPQESTNWRALPHGFGMRGFPVNFKPTRKPCSGASSLSWHHSLLQGQRATRTNGGSSPTQGGETDSNAP